MELRFKAAFAVTVCALLLLTAISIASADPVLLWQEGQNTPNILGGQRGNIYYGGGVFNNTWYTAQLEYGPMQWSTVQSNGTALINSVNANTAAISLGKSCTKIGPWLFCGRSTNGLIRLAPWDGTTITDLANTGPESCTTDGTYLYTNDYNTKNMICKYQVNADGSTTKLWGILITGSGAIRLRGISYYDGKLYAVDHNATDRGIFEIDAGTGAYTRIATYPDFGGAVNAYQVVRYGNQMFGVGLDDKLQVFQFNGTSWSLANTYSLGLDDEYGIGVLGNGTQAQYAWISSKTNTIDSSIIKQVSFWAINPAPVSPSTLGNARNQTDGALVTVNNLAVTLVGDKEFFAQEKDRSSGIRIKWDGTLPAKDTLVSVTGFIGTNDGGRFLKAVIVNPGADYTVKPIAMPSKSAIAKYQPGAAGLGIDGVLVKVVGRITDVDWQGDIWYYLDDGSGVINDSPIPEHNLAKVPGIKVMKYSATTIAIPYIDALPYVSAIGVVSTQKVNGQIIPVLYMRDDFDNKWLKD